MAQSKKDEDGGSKPKKAKNLEGKNIEIGNGSMLDRTKRYIPFHMIFI